MQAYAVITFSHIVVPSWQDLVLMIKSAFGDDNDNYYYGYDTISIFLYLLNLTEFPIELFQ